MQWLPVIFRVRVHVTKPINVIIVVPLIGWDLPPFLTVDIVTLYPCEILNLQQITEIKGTCMYISFGLLSDSIIMIDGNQFTPYKNVVL